MIFLNAITIRTVVIWALTSEPIGFIRISSGYCCRLGLVCERLDVLRGFRGFYFVNFFGLVGL